MCGIAGIVSFDPNGCSLVPNAERMAARMGRRGPDDEGFLAAYRQLSKKAVPLSGDATPELGAKLHFHPQSHVSSIRDQACSVALAHRRLSIIDLSPSGHQPMSTEDGRFWIVYNGEIYNHQYIRSELAESGEEFFGNSDTEVLLKAYRRWGRECLSHLNGMFAFVIWDDVDKCLFCARDRIGIKPFYYYFGDRFFVFASDIAAIIASGLYTPQPDLEGLYHALSFGVAPRPMTAFKGIKALEQGHWMTIPLDGSIKKERYWDVPTGTQRLDMEKDEAASLIKRHLEAAVEKRLVADVPVGTFMSGGIDSTTVSAIASMKHPGIKAFTLAFKEDKELDELAQASATARMYRMDHVVQNVAAESVIDHLQQIVECYEEPFYDISPNYLISKLVAENGVRVVLNGLGGDELFGGYPYFKWEGRWRLLQRVRPLLWIASHLPIVGHLGERLRRIADTHTGDRFASSVRCFFTDREKKALFLDQSVRDFDTVERIHQLYVGDREFSSVIEAISYIDLVNYIGNHHVYRVDKFTMYFSLEGRIPFLDHELVEMAYTIPDHWKIRDGQGKYILREVAKDYIHRSCLEAPKKGFDLPTDRWMRGILADFVADKLRLLCERGLFDPSAVWKVFREWKVRARSFRSVWELVSVEMWFELFFD